MDDAARGLYEFIWNEYCDWYVELAKPSLRAGGERKSQVQAVLHTVLEGVLRLLHPITPFITEEIWQALPHDGESIMIAPYPEADASMFDAQAEQQMAMVIDTVRAVRNLRAELGVAPGKPVSVLAVCEDSTLKLAQASEDTIKSLARVESLTFADSVPDTDTNKYVSAHLPGIDLFVEVAGLVDVEKELARIDTELASIQKELTRVTGKLSNDSFTSKAPAQIVEKERRIAAELEDKRAKLLERRKAME